MPPATGAVSAAERLDRALGRTIELAAAAGEDLAGVVTYDEGMADAAAALGLTALAPGR